MEEENKKEKEGTSFSMQVKEELSGVMGSARHCQLAELSALILCCGKLIDGEALSGSTEKLDENENENLNKSNKSCNSKTLIFESENESVLRKYFTFVQKTFNIELMRVHKGNGYALGLNAQDTKTILQAVKLSEGDSLEDCTADSRLLLRNCCRRAFIRGCFLASGSISAPQKGYHFEIVTVSEARALQLQQLIHSCGIEAKTVVRKKYHVVYAKEGEQIADLLSLMEAPKARMDFENIRILKDVRNSVNRKVNCEAANLNKTANASLEQVRDIEYISEYYGLESLPENLKQAARLRLEKPDASLTELGKLMDPPVSKSGVNHRFKKLKALANAVREKGGRL